MFDTSTQAPSGDKTTRPDAATEKFLQLINSSAQPPIWELDPTTARATYNPISEASQHKPEAVGKIEGLLIPGHGGKLPIRTYHPKHSAERPPILIFFHGGGFVLGNLDTHDSLCRSLAKRSGAIVVAVDYRLSPETKPADALEDAYAATCWARKHAGELGGDPLYLAVGGDSAGGGLAAGTALLARDRNGPEIAFQLLIYPAIDAARSQLRYKSFRKFSKGYFLTKEMIDWFAANHGDPTGPPLSLLTSQRHCGLPPAFILTAGLDPLRDEADAYATALRDAGVQVRHSHYDNTIHGFMSLGKFIPTAIEAIDECALRLREALCRTG